MDFLGNDWVIGVGGGVLSGLLVTLITRYLFSKKDDKEYAQNLASVNKEVVYALRPGISEGHIPDKDVLSSLLNATARKYKVEVKDVYRPKHIAEELIKEIMDSSFISSDTKKSYCETLSHLVKEETLTANSEIIQNIEHKITESDYRQDLVARMSAILGLTAAMGTMSFTLLIDKGLADSTSIFSKAFGFTAPTFMVVIATVVAMLGMVIAMRLKAINKNESVGEKSNKSLKQDK
jgi:hypothetical protein